MATIETVRSACHIHEPYVSECFVHWPSNNCSFPGIEAEFNWQMLSVLGFNVQFIKANSSEELFHLIANGSADITCNAKELSMKNSQFGYPTVPISEDYPIFILPDTGGQSMDSNILLSTCHRSVWLTCLTLGLCCFLIGRFTKKMERPQWNSVGKIVRVSYYLALGIVLGVCSNFLAVALSVPVATNPVFNSLLEYSLLVATGKCRTIMVEQSMEYAAMKDLVNPEDTHLNPLVRNNLQKAYAINPPTTVKTLPSLINQIKSSPGCLIGIDWHLGRPFTEKQYCHLKVYDFFPNKKSYVFYSRKHWPHREALESLITKTSMEDLYQRIVKKYVARSYKNNCVDIKKGSHGLSIGQMIDTFYILSFICVLAVIVFCLEKIAYALRKQGQMCVTHGDITV